MARPTKLTPELLEQAKAYMARHDISISTLLPTVEGLAYELKIHRDTLYAWEKEDTEFSDILEDLRALQGNKLIQNSLQNRYNPTIAKMLLSSKHGYVEKSEVDQNIKGDVTFINDVPRPKNEK